MNNKLEITGKIILIHPTQIFASGFQKREFIITDEDEKYPQEIKLEAMKDGCDKLDSFKVGDEVTVSFNIRGNEYNGKHFVSLQAWKITKDQAQDSLPAGRQQQKTMPPAPAPGMSDALDEDECETIPF